MPSSLVRVGLDVLKSTLSTKANSILLQIGDVLQQIAETDNVELWQTFGLVSKPPKASAGKAAGQVVVVSKGDHDVAIAGRDLRGQELTGQLDDGETCVYGSGPDGTSQGRTIYKSDGSVTTFTTVGNEAGASAVFWRISPTGLEFVAPWGTLRFDESGFHVKHASGARLDLGGIGGLPSPLDTLGSYASISAATARVHGGLVMIGPKGATYNPATFGLYENPLTFPAVPISPAGLGIPCGLFTSGSVRIGT